MSWNWKKGTASYDVIVIQTCYQLWSLPHTSLCWLGYKRGTVATLASWAHKLVFCTIAKLVKMTALSLKFLFVLSGISVFSLGTGEANTCPTTASTQCIPGLPGRDGQPGPPGPSGLNGHNGHDGAAGVTGPQGPAGLNGTNGQQGPIGPQGPQGPVGPTGLQGPAGLDGTNGQQGPTGPQGPQGPVGPTGPQGPAGAPGADGADGLPGSPGTLSNATIDRLKSNFLEDVQKLLLCKGITESNPVASCEEIYKCNPTTPFGKYWINSSTGPVQVYCSAGTQGDLIQIIIKHVGIYLPRTHLSILLYTAKNS